MIAHRSAASVLVVLLAVVGCTAKPASGQPDHAPSSAPPPAPVSLSPTPSPTPSQEELSRQAQAAYQIAFDEYERLARAGGAEEPSAKMLEVEEGLYLQQDLALLKYQKDQGVKVEGDPSVTKSRPVPSASKGGSDERLTLQICEDRRASRAVYSDGRQGPNRLWQGFVYGKLVNGTVKLTDVDTKEVQRCDW